MAHRLSIRTDGRAEMAYTGEVPWHRLGTKVDGLQSAHAMLGAASMTWEVATRGLLRKDGSPAQDIVEIHRTDNDAKLGYATPKYRVIQNSQAADVMDAVALEGQAMVETAGAIDGGEICWMLSHLPDDFEVVKGDLLKPYFLLAWGHDGKHGLAGKLTLTRVVCANTLQAAGFGVRGRRWSEAADFYVKHNGNAKLRLDEAQKALGIVRKQISATNQAYQAFARTEMTPVEAEAYFQSIFPSPALPQSQDGIKGYNESKERWENVQAELEKLFAEGKGSDLAPNTVWNGYNAITEWTDHVYPVLQNGDVSTTRQQSVLFGAYAKVKSTAFNQALALVN